MLPGAIANPTLTIARQRRLDGVVTHGQTSVVEVNFVRCARSRRRKWRVKKYFVETDQWNRIVKGEIDVIIGAKGAGKRAIYSLLITQEREFLDRNTLPVPGEKPRGTPVFKDIIANPPPRKLSLSGFGSSTS